MLPDTGTGGWGEGEAGGGWQSKMVDWLKVRAAARAVVAAS